MSTGNEPILQKKSVSTPIYSLTPFTLLDYPHRSACILWFAGCNMRCVYCYNPDIVFGKGKLSFEQAIAFLQTRKGLLDAVVFSGGECLLHKDIIVFADTIKQMGFLIKIDTNGSRPDILEKLSESGLIDYVALDFKALPSKFKAITQSDLFAPFEKSVRLLLQNRVPFEIRTTIHSKLIDNTQIRRMASWLEQIGYHGKYFLQHYVNDMETIAPLPYSSRTNSAAAFELKNIEIVFRG